MIERTEDAAAIHTHGLEDSIPIEKTAVEDGYGGF
jgi:hypothetical protein